MKQAFVCVIIFISLLVGCGSESNNAIIPNTNIAEPEKRIRQSYDQFTIYVYTDKGSVYLIGKDRRLNNFSVRIGLQKLEEPDISKHAVDSFLEVADLLAVSPEFGTSIAPTHLYTDGEEKVMLLFVSAPGAYGGKGAVCLFVYHSQVGWIEMESARLTGEHPGQQFGLDISIRWEEGWGVFDDIDHKTVEGIIVDGTVYLWDEFFETEEILQEAEEKLLNPIDEQENGE